MVKNSPANAGDTRDVGSIPGLGKPPGEGNGNLLQYSCLENPTDRGAWQAQRQHASQGWRPLCFRPSKHLKALKDSDLTVTLFLLKKRLMIAPDTQESLRPLSQIQSSSAVNRACAISHHVSCCFLNPDWGNYRLLWECPGAPQGRNVLHVSGSSMEIHISTWCLVHGTSRFLCCLLLSLLLHILANSAIFVWGQEFILNLRMISSQGQKGEWASLPFPSATSLSTTQEMPPLWKAPQSTHLCPCQAASCWGPCQRWVSSALSSESSTFRNNCVCSAAQLRPTLCNPLDYSPPGPSVHGILQARILGQVALSFSRGSSRPTDGTQVSCLGGQILHHCASWEILAEQLQEVSIFWVM